MASAPQLQATGAPPIVQVEGGKNPAPVEIRMRKTDGNGDQLYAGIGMALYPNGNEKFAGEVFEGGPAHDAAIRTGDQILAIDGVSTDGLSIQDLAGRIRGPEGSEVTLQMRRGAAGEAYTVVVPRAEIRF
jgi:carboxyl-terminal processing protease